MGALLWGSGFAFLAVLTLFLSYVNLVIYKTSQIRHPFSPALAVRAYEHMPGEQAESKLVMELPRLLMPGFRLSCIVQYDFTETRSFLYESPVKGGANKRVAEISLPSRGEYLAERIEIKISDLLGFTELHFYAPIKSRFRVYPYLYQIDTEVFEFFAGGGHLSQSKRRLENEELHEVRKYFPGDDTRRLNWKIYAHSGELFIRKGEENPPPEAGIVIALDTSIIPQNGHDRVDSLFLGQFLDEFLSFSISVLHAMARKGYHVMCLLPMEDHLFEVDPMKIEEYLHLFSSLWWKQNSKPEISFEIPQELQTNVILISTPFSCAIDAILRFAEKKFHRTGLFIKSRDFEEHHRPQKGIREFLFPNESLSSLEHQLEMRAKGPFEDQLEEQLGLARSGKWKVDYVDTV